MEVHGTPVGGWDGYRPSDPLPLVDSCAGRVGRIKGQRVKVVRLKHAGKVLMTYHSSRPGPSIRSAFYLLFFSPALILPLFYFHFPVDNQQELTYLPVDCLKERRLWNRSQTFFPERWTFWS